MSIIAAMSQMNWESIMSYVGTFSIGGLVVFCLNSYILSYLSKKAQNLATREDIAIITKEIEEVRSQYAVFLEELKSKHQTKNLLRMAAIDRRLVAHQEAFTLWRGLITREEDVGKAVLKCQEWWEKNCIYLEPKVRQAFVEAYSNANMHSEFVQMRADSKHIMETWAQVTKFPNILFEAVKLPELTENETKALKLEDPEATP